MALSETLAQGDTLASLEAVRDQISADLDVCESMRDRASLYLRLQDILTKIEDLKPRETAGDKLDELAARRAQRRAS